MSSENSNKIVAKMDTQIIKNARNNVNEKTFRKLTVNNGTDNKKTVSVNKKNVNIGLQIPGSNWEMYKNIIATETVLTNQVSNDIHIRKIKNINKPFKKHDKHLLQSTEKNQISKFNIKENKNEVEGQTGLTRVIAMDCEMVGIKDGQGSMIARVSIVNHYGVCVYDKYVKPTEKVQDYRTEISGIRPHHLKTGEDFKIVQKEVSDILKGRILVGHALHNDLRVLFLTHPKHFQRDTSRYFRNITTGNIPSLKKLASELLDLDIQSGEHDSVEDARTTMQLYKLFKKQWESDIRQR